MGTRHATTENRTATATGESNEGATEGQNAWRYQYLLRVAHALDTPSTLDEFADAMYEWECERGRELTGKSWSDIHEELYLIDLPVLDGAGHLDFDADRGLVRTESDAE